MKRIKIPWFFNSLQKKFIALFIIIIIIPFFIYTVYSYRAFSKEINNKIINSILNTLLQIKYNIESKTDTINIASDLICEDLTIKNILDQDYSGDEKEKIEGKIKAKEILYYIKRNIMTIKANITLISFKGDIYTTSVVDEKIYEKIISQEWFEGIIKNDGEAFWFFLNESNIGMISLDKRNIAIGKVIKNKFMKDCGIIIISINETEIYNIIKKTNIDYDNNRFIVDNDLNVVSKINAEIILFWDRKFCRDMDKLIYSEAS